MTAKNNYKITFIYLVITIIVLLILAGVTIVTLTGDNGVLTKAKYAVDKYSDAEIGEQIKLAYLELQTEKLYNSNVDDVEFLTNRLKQTFGNDNVRNLSVTNGKVSVEIKSKSDFKRFSYDVGTGVIKEEWVQNVDGSFSNGNTKGVQVGDIVHYETVLAQNAVNSTKKAQLISDLGTYSGNTNTSQNTDSSVVRDNLTWSVLDVKDGKIRLISTVPTKSGIGLYGEDGYNNAVYLIDKACDTLYSIDGVGKVQNLKIEDIQEKIDKTQFDYTQYSNWRVDTGKYGGTAEYTGDLQYPNIYPSEIGCKGIDGESGTNNNTGTLGLSEQTSPVTGKTTEISRLKVATTYWRKSMVSTDFIDSKYYTLFINNGSNLFYCLSSRCVEFWNGVNFSVRRVYNGEVWVSTIFYSTLGTNGSNGAGPLRPVITLDSNIQLSGNSTNGWTIN